MYISLHHRSFRDLRKNTWLFPAELGEEASNLPYARQLIYMTITFSRCPITVEITPVLDSWLLVVVEVKILPFTSMYAWD